MITSVAEIMEPLYNGGNVNWYSLFRYTMEFLKKLKVELLYDPATPVLYIHFRKKKAGSQRDICIPRPLQHYSQ